jgi:flagellar motor switch protein FliM
VTQTSPPRAARRRSAGPQPYDFRRPSKFGREHVRAFQIVGETFARQLATVLSTTLRAVSVVQQGEIEQVSYDEYVRSIPNPSYLLVCSLAPLPGASILQIELPIALTAVERLVGGTHPATELNRPLTEIEQSLMRGLVERALRELEFSFESLTRLSARVVQLESNPQFAQIAAPSDMSVVMTWDVRIVEQRGRVSLCIPSSALEPVLDAYARQSHFADRAGDSSAFACELAAAVDHVPVEVRVSFRPVTLTSAEIVDLRPGHVVPLQHRVDDPLTVSVGDVACYPAIAGRRGKRLACVVVADQEAQ